MTYMYFIKFDTVFPRLPNWFSAAVSIYSILTHGTCIESIINVKTNIPNLLLATLCALICLCLCPRCCFFAQLFSHSFFSDFFFAINDTTQWCDIFSSFLISLNSTTQIMTEMFNLSWMMEMFDLRHFATRSHNFDMLKAKRTRLIGMTWVDERMIWQCQMIEMSTEI